MTDKEAMDGRPQPKFKVGQIVVMKSLEGELLLRILAVDWFMDGWYYAWNRRNYAAERMIRELTPEEKGV